jgi:vacuolar-type H+-ATPase subunit H
MNIFRNFYKVLFYMGKTYNKKMKKSSSRRKSRSRKGGLESTKSMPSMSKSMPSMSKSMPSMSKSMPSMSKSVESFKNEAKKTADNHYQKGMDSAKKTADKHINDAKKITAQHSENVKNIGIQKMDILNKNAKNAYNDVKYKSSTNFIAAKMGENTFNQGKKYTKSMIPSTSTMGTYSPKFNMSTAKLAESRSDRGVPSVQYAYNPQSQAP